MRFSIFTLLCTAFVQVACAQNSMVGDGFGGRKWYKPTNYTVGSYSAYSLCYSNPCDTSTNQLMGWGANGYGQLGLTLSFGSATPVAIPNMTNVRYYSTGYYMGAIKNDGSGWVWGNGLAVPPAQVISNAKFLDGSAGFVSFVKQDGTVWSIGDNTGGNFGDGTTNSNMVSCVQMQNINTAVRVACGYMTTYVLLTNGKVMAVGDNSLMGVLGTSSSNFLEVLPDTVLNVNNIIDIKAHSLAVAALDSSGKVWVWGMGGYIGDSTMNPAIIPKQIGLTDIVAISACCDGYHFLALDANKNCYAWGDPGASGNSVFGTIPTLVATDVIDIMAGETFSYIVKSDGSLWGVGASNGASIWLNLPDTFRLQYTQLNPALVPGACPLISATAITTNSCAGGGGSIMVNYAGGTPPYSYNIGGGPQSSPVFSGLAPGTYSIVITDANGCITSLVATIGTSSQQPPVVSVTSTLGCAGSPVNLTASGALNYVWSGPGLSSTTGSTVSATVSSTTTYTVVGTDANGCSDTAVSTVTIIPGPAVTGGGAICQGQSVNLLASGNGTFSWSPAGSLSSSTGSSVLATPNATTTYTLTNSNPPCVFTKTITVSVTVQPNAIIQSATGSAFPVNTPIVFHNQSTNEQSVIWQDCFGNTSSLDSLLLNFSDAGNCCIRLIAKNGNCYDSTTSCFTVYEPILISIPNVFSPNGDGINDVFFIKSQGITRLHCEIYDRWGLKLYEWDGPAGYWNGKTKSGDASDGTYYYLVTYEGEAGKQFTEHGFLTLIDERD